MPGDSKQYLYVLQDGSKVPDPLSRYQPEGVFGPPTAMYFPGPEKRVRNPERHLEDAIIYEMHVGTFTPEGTFRAAAEKVDDLLDLGVNTIEVMPVAEAMGSFNWGYDGVFPFAPNHNYGTPPRDLMDFVEHCHRLALSVILDVVYNHLGPVGNHFYPPLCNIFSERYSTPWAGASTTTAPPVLTSSGRYSRRTWSTGLRHSGSTA